MSNPKQDIALGEATRGTSVANIRETMAEDENRKITGQSQMPGRME